MGQTWQRLKAEGVEALAIVATTPDNARLYFRSHPPSLGAVPGGPGGHYPLDEHRVWSGGLAGLGKFPTDDELLAAVRAFSR